MKVTNLLRQQNFKHRIVGNTNDELWFTKKSVHLANSAKSKSKSR